MATRSSGGDRKEKVLKVKLARKELILALRNDRSKTLQELLMMLARHYHRIYLEAQVDESEVG